MSARSGKEKEPNKEKTKTRTRSTKDSVTEQSTERDDENTEKLEKQEKQVKIDSMLIPTTPKEKEPSIADMISVINAFDEKLSLMASKDYIEKSLSKLVSEKFVNDKLEKLKVELGIEIKTELDKVYEQLRSVKEKLHITGNEVEELKNSHSALSDEVEKVKVENEFIKQKNKALEELLVERENRIKVHGVMMNNMEQYTRRNSIRIYGIDDQQREETYEKSRELVIKMLNDKLSINLTSKDIDVAHRLGKFLTDGNRPIICKFVRRSTKFEVLAVRRRLKGSSIVIREDLTTKNAKLLETVSAKPEVKNAWSHDGKIIALLRNGKKIRVDLLSNLDQPLVSRDEMERVMSEIRSTKL